MSDHKLPARSSATQVAEFLGQVARLPTHREGRGRLIFALDATASRQPTWDRACHLQAEMFMETTRLGGLSVQLVWYRGFGEFHAGRWVSSADDLLAQMDRVFCVGGTTQIERVLRHAVHETRSHRINALVFVGDCLEEDPGPLYDLAGELGLLGTPVFVFHEGGDPEVGAVFQRIARLSHGAYSPFDAGSAQQLRDLLNAVAVYAAGGRPALEDFGRRAGGAVLRLTHQLKGGR